MKVTLNRKCNTWVCSRCKLCVRLLKRHTTSLSLIVQPSLTTTMCAFGQFFWFLGPSFAYTVEDLLKLQFESFFFLCHWKVCVPYFPKTPNTSHLELWSLNYTNGKLDYLSQNFPMLIFVHFVQTISENSKKIKWSRLNHYVEKHT